MNLIAQLIQFLINNDATLQYEIMFECLEENQ